MASRQHYACACRPEPLTFLTARQMEAEDEGEAAEEVGEIADGL